MTPSQAKQCGVVESDIMLLKVNTPRCSVTFDHVLVRYIVNGKKEGDGGESGGFKAWLKGAVQESILSLATSTGMLKLPMQVHLDTDEGNACMLQDATSYDLYRRDAVGKLLHVCRAPAKPKPASRDALLAREAARPAYSQALVAEPVAGKLPRSRL
jgi:hypothetical protein